MNGGFRAAIFVPGSTRTGVPSEVASATWQLRAGRSPVAPPLTVLGAFMEILMSHVTVVCPTMGNGMVAVGSERPASLDSWVKLATGSVARARDLLGVVPGVAEAIARHNRAYLHSQLATGLVRT